MQSTSATIEGNRAPWWQAVLSLDCRSLAVLRIALGVLLVADVLMRWPTAADFYSDSGYFTRALWREWCQQRLGPLGASWAWSWYGWSGSTSWVYGGLATEAVAAVLLILGWGTRWVTILLWFLVASLHTRSPLTTSSGDTLMTLMLFWAMFLPWGRYWSVDAWRRKGPAPAPTEFSAATAAFQLQLVLMYFFTGIAKWNPVWLDGTAMFYVLRQEIYVREAGKWLLEYPWLLKLTSWSTLAAELPGIWLIFVPWRNGWWRMTVMAVYWAFHLGIAATMSIGLFPWICIAAWLALLPGGLWDWLLGPPSMTAKQPPASQSNRPGPHHWLRTIANGFCLLMLCTVALWNIANMDHPRWNWVLPRPLQWLGHVTATRQFFQMFGVPYKESPWFIYRGRLRDGREVDLFRNGLPVDESKPARIPETLPDHHWRVLHRNLMAVELEDFRQPLLEFKVREWNAEHPAEQQVVSAELVMRSEPTGPDYNGIDQASSRWAVWRDPDATEDARIDDLRNRLRNLRNRGF